MLTASKSNDDYVRRRRVVLLANGGRENGLQRGTWQPITDKIVRNGQQPADGSDTVRFEIVSCHGAILQPALDPDEADPRANEFSPVSRTVLSSLD